MNDSTVAKVLLGTGNDAVMQLCIRRRALYSDIDTLQASLNEIEQELAKTSAREKSQIEVINTQLQELESDYNDALKSSKLDKLKLSKNQKIVNSPLHSTLAFLGSLFSSTAKSIDQIKSEIDALEIKQKNSRKHISDTEKRIAVKHNKLEQLESPMNSMEFAVVSLNDQLGKVHQKIKECDRSINAEIQMCARYTSATAMAVKSQLLKDISGSNDKIESLLKLRTLLLQYSSLGEQVEAANKAANWYSSPRNLVEQGFIQDSFSAYGVIPMSGEGTAHKKVRSGKNTRWKKINVNFNGNVTAQPVFTMPLWSPQKTSGDMAEKSKELFNNGLIYKREELIEKMRNKLKEQIDTITASIRHELAIPQ